MHCCQAEVRDSMSYNLNSNKTDVLLIGSVNNTNILTPLFQSFSALVKPTVKELKSIKMFIITNHIIITFLTNVLKTYCNKCGDSVHSSYNVLFICSLNLWLWSLYCCWPICSCYAYLKKHFSCTAPFKCLHKVYCHYYYFVLVIHWKRC